MSSITPSFHNQYVYHRHHFVPCDPTLIHEITVGEIIGWNSSSCQGNQLNYSIEHGKLQSKAFGSINIASENVKILAVELEATAANAGGFGVAFSFEADRQKVIKADECVCTFWDATRQDIHERMKKLSEEKKLESGEYAVVLSTIKAANASIYEGQKDEVVFSTSIVAQVQCLPVGLKTKLNIENKREIKCSMGPLPNAIVGYHIWTCKITWLRHKVEVGENLMGMEQENHADGMVNKAIIDVPQNELNFEL